MALIAVLATHFVWVGARTVSAVGPLEAWVVGRSLQTRIEAGGQYWPLVPSEPWRLLTSVLLHVDLGHLLLNSLSAYVLGRLLEPWIGALRYWAVFVVCGVAGSGVSHVLGAQQSDGASGGLYGLLAVLMVVAVRRRSELHPDEWRMLGPWLWGFTALNFVASLAIPTVDFAGHLGGWLAGLAIGGVVGWRPIEG